MAYSRRTANEYAFAGMIGYCVLMTAFTVLFHVIVMMSLPGANYSDDPIVGGAYALTFTFYIPPLALALAFSDAYTRLVESSNGTKSSGNQIGVAVAITHAVAAVAAFVASILFLWATSVRCAAPVSSSVSHALTTCRGEGDTRLRWQGIVAPVFSVIVLVVYGAAVILFLLWKTFFQEKYMARKQQQAGSYERLREESSRSSYGQGEEEEEMPPPPPPYPGRPAAEMAGAGASIFHSKRTSHRFNPVMQ